jgi:hypothetical protein
MIMKRVDNNITKWLSGRNRIVSTIFISLTAFLVYACMYGLRKPFTVAEFQGLAYFGIDFKALLIISQVIGYALSKFLGIKVISEMKRSGRAISIVVLTGIAECTLVLFSIVKPPFSLILIFLNGLSLGMIWGLVFSYLEGRRTTEILGTVLSISFIVSSGFVKSVGKSVMTSFHLTDFQMPWITGLIFYIPLVLMVWILDKTPEPTKEDILARTKRIPMNKEQRNKIFREYAVGLVMLILSYILLTVYRDLRDNFAADIWKSAGISGNPMIFTWSELPIALVVFMVMSSLMLVKDNRKALILNNYIILSGFIIIGLSTLALNSGLISPVAWMVLLGTGTYLGYLPFNCLLFDRMIAAFGSAANAGFFIYIADSFGYMGSVSALIFKSFNNRELSWVNFIIKSSYGLALTGSLLIILSIIYFNKKIKNSSTSPVNPISQKLEIIVT